MAAEDLPVYKGYNMVLAYDPRLFAAIGALVVVYLLAGDLFWIEHQGL